MAKSSAAGARSGSPGGAIRSFRDLVIYQRAFAAAMRVFEITKAFPIEERYSLTDQIRRSSRSVAINIVEAWRKRRYQAAFVSKLSDAETEAAESQAWLEFSVKCGYVPRQVAAEVYREYEAILRGIVGMIMHADEWTIQSRRTQPQ